jgi:hypothetical protein
MIPPGPERQGKILLPSAGKPESEIFIRDERCSRGRLHTNFPASLLG